MRIRPAILRVGAAGAFIFALSVGTSASAAEIRTAPPGNIDFINGGITQDEADAMRAEGRSFPLEVVLAQYRGDEGNAFVADANVRIYDSAGREFAELPNSGPIILANLPDGRYTVEAEFHGNTKRQQVVITGRGHRKVGFQW
jgi:hypothetical protein